MIDATSVSPGELVYIYAVANTPTYLFRRFRVYPTVTVLAERYSAFELVQLALSIDKQPIRTVHDVSIAYAAIVALTLKSYPDVQAALKGNAFSNLEWADKLIALWEADRIPTNIVSQTLDLRSFDTPSVSGRPSSTSQSLIVLPAGGDRVAH